MKLKKKVYTYEEVLGQFQGQVERFKNDSARVPSRNASAEDIEKYAVKLHREEFKDALNPSVIDQYKAHK
jgi:hypothetical protein